MNTATTLRTGIVAGMAATLVACTSFALAGEPARSASAESDSAKTAITAEDVQTYCGTCHFASVDNASIASFNRETVNRAMVESMVPQLDDATIDALADYFAQIEPPAQQDDQH